MRLTDLEPTFRKIDRRIDTWTIHKEDDTTEQVTGLRLYAVEVATIEEADGLWLLCPLCFKNNNGKIGTHSISCWKLNIPQSDDLTGPGRWDLCGTGFNDLSLRGAETSSVLLTQRCKAHFSIVNGDIIWH